MGAREQGRIRILHSLSAPLLPSSPAPQLPMQHQRKAKRPTTPRPSQPTDAYHVLVQCVDERQQRRVYEQLKAQGLRCRVLTL